MLQAGRCRLDLRASEPLLAATAPLHPSASTEMNSMLSCALWAGIQVVVVFKVGVGSWSPCVQANREVM